MWGGGGGCIWWLCVVVHVCECFCMCPPSLTPGHCQSVEVGLLQGQCCHHLTVHLAAQGVTLHSGRSGTGEAGSGQAHARG